MSSQSYTAALRFINQYWKQSTFTLPKDQGIHIGLPQPFVSPNAHLFKQDQFYWDSFFIILGLVVSGKIELAKGMVENLAHLFDRFGLIPSRNRFYNVGISQPPFLSSMINEVFQHSKDKHWLERLAEVAETELNSYWMYEGSEKAETHLVYQGLSRYVDHNIIHHTAEHESGWDMTSRFYGMCLNDLPVDLNCLLYKYEVDLASFYQILGQNYKAKKYAQRAARRQETINKLMWNSKAGFFFDYNYTLKKQQRFYSLAGFYPLWVGLASPRQAQSMHKALKKFEYAGGLANTQSHGLFKEFKQWDFPNGWANNQWIVIEGLRRYGFEEDANRLAKKWLDMNHRVFLRTGKFWEKYNVVIGGVGKEERYPNQYGFGWTNGVFVRLVHDFT